ncbi:hypothetical protein PROFUN_06584 [Planoprotostelium fungivorum]|uniref:Bystin n=1 Tax=Planoprotostelium fungivorum TaxID=1890364 RepID=A0A2P6MRX9_9EUKA|nr:hypothetical protein PROFUN_06584 [Planoprotostelium fungivorum]
MAGGKANQVTKNKRVLQRHQPLQSQIEESEKTSKPIKQRAQKGKRVEEDDAQEVDAALSAKILSAARQQFSEEQDERRKNKPLTPVKPQLMQEDDSDEEEIDEEEYEEVEEVELSEEDAKAFEAFFPKETAKRQTLGDIIMSKMAEAKGEITAEQAQQHIGSQFSPKVVQVYTSVGKLLANYSIGKIPKAFKMIPSLEKWEELLYLTNPDEWTPNAMYQAVRLFSSIMSPEIAQRFYNLILLPAVLSDIEEHKKLNFHYYQALKKCLYKPAAFFKGIMLPLVESGDCQLREATIICSILGKTSVPVLHSSAALLKLAEMDYSPALAMFIGTLLQKKYALPYRVVDAVVNHFLAVTNSNELMPVLWHRAFLTFIQRYRSDLLPEQKQAIHKLIKAQPHEFFTFEVRRELANSVNRGEAPTAATSTAMDI